MSDSFEDNISQRMDGFQLTPGPQVWEQVEAALPDKRRRRIAIWWWLPLAACLGGGVWLAIDKQTGTGKKLISGTTETSSAEYSTQKKSLKQASGDTSGNEAATQQQTVIISEKQNRIQPTDKINKEQVATTTDSISRIQITPNSKENKTNNYAGKSSIAWQPAVTKVKRTAATAKTEEKVAETVPPVIDEPLESVALKLNAATDNAQLKIPVNYDSLSIVEPTFPIIDLANNHLATATIAKDTISIKIADTVLKTFVETITPQLKKKINKTVWSLTIAVGKSRLNNDNSIKLQSAFRNDFNGGSPIVIPSGPANGAVRVTGVFSNPESGFGFNAGITRSQVISKHFSWQAAISYQLLTSTQRIGRRNDSLLRITRLNDSLQNKSSSGTSAAFFTGSAANYTNKIHRIQIATGVAYLLNPGARSPIRFAAGGFVAFNISNNLLLHDYRSFSYIRSAELSNKWMWGGEIGFDVFINRTIKAGLFYQHDFTNVGKPKVISVFRWNQLQLRVGIPLSKH